MIELLRWADEHRRGRGRGRGRARTQIARAPVSAQFVRYPIRNREKLKDHDKVYSSQETSLRAVLTQPEREDGNKFRSFLSALTEKRVDAFIPVPFSSIRT